MKSLCTLTLTIIYLLDTGLLKDLRFATFTFKNH